jgi:D-alanine-D-alanine ligase
MKSIADFGCVAVLMGGSAAEREVSLKSGTAVYESLVRSGINAMAVDVTSSIYQAIQEQHFDRAINVIHGRGGEDGITQAILETLNLPYTGSGVMASALSMDKLRTKLCWQGSGLQTPPWVVLKSEKDVDRCTEILSFPVIVKPSLEGSSLGMSRAENKEELMLAWQEAAKYQCDVYAEAWVLGKEYTVGILAGKALPVIRLETPHIFYDYDAKYSANTTQYYCPAGLSMTTESALADLALQACDIIGVSGWGRVDAFIDEQGNSQLIEVNTVPGMTGHSLVPMAAKQAGIEFDELVLQILATSMNND